MDDLLKLIKMYDARGRQINRLQRVLARKNRRIHRQHMQLKELSRFQFDPNAKVVAGDEDPIYVDEGALGYIDLPPGWSKPQTVSEVQPHAD